MYDDYDIMSEEGKEKIFKFSMRRYTDYDKALMLEK